MALLFFLVPAAGAILAESILRALAIAVWALLYLASVYGDVATTRRKKSAEELSRERRKAAQQEADDQLVDSLRKAIGSGLDLVQSVRNGEPAGNRAEEWTTVQATLIRTHVGEPEASEFETRYESLTEGEKKSLGRRWEHTSQLYTPYLRELIDRIKAGTTHALVRNAEAASQPQHE